MRCSARGVELTTAANGGETSAAFSRTGQYYDIIYGAKDYDRETDFIAGVVKLHSAVPVVKVLDLGCGTGGHLLRMARFGWELTGVDIAESMLEVARVKALEMGVEARFLKGDLRSFHLDEQFDLVTCMFSSFGYITDNAGVRVALNGVRRQLRPGGLFVLEFWHGPAVLSQPPESRVAQWEHDDLLLVRVAEPTLDVLSHTATIKYEIWAMRGQTVVDHIVEHHLVRFFFPQELSHYFDDMGMEVCGFYAFPDLERAPTRTDWNAVVVGRARTSLTK